jgi:ankyrin repeat protein
MQSVTVTDSAETPELPNHSIAFEYVSRGEIDELKSYMSSQPQAMQEMDSEGFFLIHWAAYFDNIEIAEWLLQLNPYAIKACTYTRATPLHVAARRNAVKVMDLLINNPQCEPVCL